MRMRIFYKKNFDEQGKYEGMTYHIEVKSEVLTFKDKRKALRALKQLEQSAIKNIKVS